MNLSDGFRLGDWHVLPLEGRIVAAVGGGESRRVRRKAMDVLCALAARGGQVVVCVVPMVLVVWLPRRSSTSRPLSVRSR